MGKKSTRENKTFYQISREEAGLTREQASELMEGVSSSRIENLAVQSLNMWAERAASENGLNRSLLQEEKNKHR